MRGHIRQRSPGHWAIVIDVRDPATGQTLLPALLQLRLLPTLLLPALLQLRLLPALLLPALLQLRLPAALPSLRLWRLWPTHLDRMGPPLVIAETALC
jgi:hypothetical protein